MPSDLRDARGLSPRGFPLARGASRTIELDDYEKSQPANGEVAVWDAARNLWVPRALTLADAPDTATRLAWTVGTSNPGSPVEGQPVYRTDLEQLLIWNGVAWRPPWNLPWGILGYVEDTDGQGYDGTETTAMTLGAITPVANRRCRLVGYVYPRSGGAAFVRVRLKEGATELQYGGGYVQAASENAGFEIERIFTPTAASHTYSLTLQIQTGSTVGALDNGATFPSHLYFEDCGPNGVPA